MYFLLLIFEKKCWLLLYLKYATHAYKSYPLIVILHYGVYMADRFE